jgi:putative oxidoreductase
METNRIQMKTTKSLDITLLITRVILAFVIASHGVQKLFGWFGGYGFDGTMGWLTGYIGLPYIAGVALILIETFGMVALAAGLFGRYLSALSILIMLGAISTFHGANGFYMNWNGDLNGEGYEYHILAIGLAIPVVLLGSGQYSLDHLLARFKASRSAQ